ncbi:MAG: hypothetical protein K5985_06140, partial [Lachnospiraceae bacterium]|nr:hypothetical protein [Lachnospiraceae bacterium]
MTEKSGSKQAARIIVIGGILIALILILTTLWSVRSALRSSEEAVRYVSNFYLGELAGRREQVVASNLENCIENMYSAIGLMEESDLSDVEHLQAFQAKMKTLYSLEKFAFVDENGLIYTSLGPLDNIDEYSFDYNTISEPEISIKDLGEGDKKVIIAIPVDDIPFNGTKLVASFMEIDIERMLEGLSLQTGEKSSTFCNLYYKDGTSLTNFVLGGQAAESNLFTALENAEFSSENGLDKVKEDFSEGREGSIAFTYLDTSENMYYVPVEGTEWMLTYLIRDSIISGHLNAISRGIITRSLLQTMIIAIVMLIVFIIIIRQNRKNARMELERKTAESASLAAQQELEERLALQEELLQQERQQRQADAMITAMASDYRSVYYVDFDSDEGICYRTDPDGEGKMWEQRHFSYSEEMTWYANQYVK